jgi:tetratricopeptide (TPR) repeat protein
MIVELNKQKYHVNSNEFNTIMHNDYNNLLIRNEVGAFERIIFILKELSKVMSSSQSSCLFFNQTHGGFIPILSSKYSTSVPHSGSVTAPTATLHPLKSFDHIYILNAGLSHIDNIHKNIASHNIENVSFSYDDANGYNNLVIYSEKYEYIDPIFIEKCCPIILTTTSSKLGKQNIYKYTYDVLGTNMTIYVPDNLHDSFVDVFKCDICTADSHDAGDTISSNNLINMCIMVKNGGPQFEEMLSKNLPIFDRWTILDTGSTDETIDIIHRVLVGKKRGTLYQEPFMNFRDSRNRLLELAGHECKYLLMLDDTYTIEGELVEFLNEISGEQTADSFTLYIKSDDVEYGSNRLLKSDRNLKYLYKIHEVVQQENNMNIVIPFEKAHIIDGRFDYMEERTMNRKQLDITLLFEELQEDPNNPRTYYYLGQTYNILQDYEKAYNYFLERGNHPVDGFIQEKIDAIFEAARIAHFKLLKEWSICEQLYLRSYELDTSRPDSLYFIGIHYHLEDNKQKAYEYFKRAFEIGYPIHCQYSLKPTLSFHYLPTFLAQLCYEFMDFDLGERCTKLYMVKNTATANMYDIMISWYNIFVHLNRMNNPLTIELIATATTATKPLLCFVADGGFAPWSGSSILTTGVGGSETYIIEMARYIQKNGHFKVIVFCNSLEHTIFEEVEYIPIQHFSPFAKQHFIHTCIISRFSEYIPVAIHGNVDNIYVVLHDLLPSGLVIPQNNKIKKIFCLSEWHVDYFIKVFPQFKDITCPFYYGVDVNKFSDEPIKVPYKFIYSSFPNRGLLQLLQMWPKIVERYPQANLHIYSDVDGKWVNSIAPELMLQIRGLLSQMSDLNIHYYGWTDKLSLANAWKTSEYWLYPCTFMETFCLTALEAALSKTLAVSNGLAALQNTIGDRGICIEGDATTIEWQENALDHLFSIMENVSKREKLIQRNYEWASTMSWESRAEKLLNDYIFVHKLEYRGMLNWTNDVPLNTNARAIFEKNILRFREGRSDAATAAAIQVLEIGTYTGTSIIELMKLIPDSYGVALDKWTNYEETSNNEVLSILQNMEQNNIENVFYRNIKTAGLENRILGIKGDSSEMLLKFTKENRMFDFIYVDGSHKCLDVTLDLFLSWNLLQKGGMMVIDDYLYNYDKFTELPFEYPFEAVNHFLNKFANEMIVLDKGYRVFIEKRLE